MNRSSFPILLVLAMAVPCHGKIAIDNGPSADEKAAYDLAQQRLLESKGISPAAAVTPVVPPQTVPPGKTAPPQLSWAENERQRAEVFNKQFGGGAYEGIVGFSRHCFIADGCNQPATMNVIGGAYKYLDLAKDVENGLTPDSPDYKNRDGQIKSGVRGAMNDFHALPGASPSYEREMIKVSDPILKKIFTPDELVQYAQKNAASSDSAPYYTYLGQTLNGTGSPAKAREAFDSALQRDPKNQAALSGRAEARYELGDFPGAVRDARAALDLNPGDQRALTALKFSENREAGRTAEALPSGAAGAEAGGGGGAGGLGSGGGADAGALARSGLAVSQDALRRSESLVGEAKRSLTLGDAKAAAEALRQAVEINPQNAQAYSLASMAYSRLKNYEAAYSSAESGLKLAPRNTILLDSEAFALIGLKDYRGALAAADLSLSINPNSAFAHFNRAAALAGLRDRPGMLEELKSAAALNPRFAPVLEAAVNLPEVTDILYLFPGETRPWGLLAGAALASGLVLAVFLAFRGARLAAPPPPPPLKTVRREPTLLAGKYEVGQEIGSGGMGVVYQGTDRSLTRPVAIKRMREEIRWDRHERERFVSEAKLVAKLKHPHIVEIHAIVEEAGEVYLIFEYVTGRTLHEVIAAEKKLPFARARQLFRGIAGALDYAQGVGVIHRDLKPANIMVDREGRARVMDFGIARLTQDALSRHSRTKTGTVVGTPPYMAPEQELSKARKESDVYSLAVCLYESLTGQRPFDGIGAGLLMNKLNLSYVPPSKAAADMPPGLDAVLAKALDPDPEKRYASAGALLRDLESLEAPSPLA